MNIKKILWLGLGMVFIILFLTTNITQSFGYKEKIKKIAELPNTSNYVIDSDEYMDLGLKYTVFQLFYLPIYQVGESEIIGYNDSEDSYISLSSEEIVLIATQNEMYLENFINVPSWDKWGGKVILLIILFLLVYFFLVKTLQSTNIEKKMQGKQHITE